MSDPAQTWAGRCNLARSILNQREACEQTAQLARAALEGASVESLAAAEWRINNLYEVK